MVFDKKDAERRMSETMKMEALCSKLTSLIPQQYRLDSAPQGSPDMPSQLMHATTYIKDLRERVERLKQRRDGCHSRIQPTTRCNVTNTAAATGSCGPHDMGVHFTGATHFNVNFTMSSQRSVELHKVIRTIEQDQPIEIIDAESCFVDDGKVVYMLKCKATSSEAVLDASMVATRLRRLLTESLA